MAMTFKSMNVNGLVGYLMAINIKINVLISKPLIFIKPLIFYKQKINGLL